MTSRCCKRGYSCGMRTNICATTIYLLLWVLNITLSCIQQRLFHKVFLDISLVIKRRFHWRVYLRSVQMNLVFMLLNDFKFFRISFHSFLIRICFIVPTIIAKNGKSFLSLFIIVFLLDLIHILGSFIEVSFILISDKIVNWATSIISIT
jgi:hypothetical protein